MVASRMQRLGTSVCGQVNTKCMGSTDKDRNFFLFQQTFHIVIQSDTLRTPGMWNGKGKGKGFFFLR